MDAYHVEPNEAGSTGGLGPEEAPWEGESAYLDLTNDRPRTPPWVYGLIAGVIVVDLVVAFFAVRMAGAIGWGEWPVALVGLAALVTLVAGWAIWRYFRETWYYDSFSYADPWGFEGIGEAPRKKTQNNLRWASGLFLIGMIALLVWLGDLGWSSVQKSIEFKLPVTPTPAATEGAAQVVAGATAGAPGTEAATAVGLPAWSKDRDLLRAAALQQYVVLASVAGILVLIPAVLLLAFAGQRVPRLTKDLQKDLKKLRLLELSEKQRTAIVSGLDWDFTGLRNYLDGTFPDKFINIELNNDPKIKEAI